MINLKDLFTTYLQVGLFGSVIIILILALRLFLRNTPRKILCVLWLIAVLRLLLPFHVESQFSLQPRYNSFDADSIVTDQSEMTPVLPPLSPVEPEIDDAPNSSDGVELIHTPMDDIQLMAYVWAGVGGVLFLYMLISYYILKFKVRDAVRFNSGIMECDRIQGAFLLGYFKPLIYIPAGLSERDRVFIIAHEQAHISRGDNWWKLTGYLCCCIHWYNPLVWLGYGLLCRDIEIACDERVIRDMDLEQRKAYSFALLNCAKRLSGFMACPVAFGEVSLKQRVKNLLSYRRPGTMITVIAVVLVILVAVCFLTTPVNDVVEQPGETTATDENEIHVYDDGVIVTEASCAEPGVREYTCTVCGNKKTESIPKLSHVYDEGVESQAASCSETGVLTYTCKSCGDTVTEKIHVLDHSFGEKTVTREANCKNEGEISVTCTQCGFRVVVERTPKTDEHDYQSKVIRKPTCVDRGKGENVCTICGHSVACDYDLGDHVYDDGVVTKEASCTEKGEKVYTCSACAVVYTETIPTKDHTWNDGSCTSPASCSVCGYTDPNGRGHAFVLARETKPSEFFAGQRTYKCSNCELFTTYYSGLSGDYDFEAVKAAGRQRAQELGLSVAPAGYEVHTGHKEVYRTDYFMVELSGGQAELERGAIQKVDSLYNYLVNNGIDLSTCYVVISVSYGSNGALGTGTFYVTVSA